MAIKEKVRSKELFDTGCGNTLLELGAIIKNLSYLITSDSLALHLAVAQKVPNLSFYAPTSAAEIETFGTGTKVISLARDYCSYRPDCDNSSLTARRIAAVLRNHLSAIGASL